MDELVDAAVVVDVVDVVAAVVDVVAATHILMV